MKGVKNLMMNSRVQYQTPKNKAYIERTAKRIKIQKK
jgi:hypothetical protein